MQYQFTNSSYDDKLKRKINTNEPGEKKSGTPGTSYPGYSGVNSITKLNAALKEKKQNAALGSNTNSATKINTFTGIPDITEKLEQKRIAKAAGSSIFRFVDKNKIPGIVKLTEKKPDDYYSSAPDYIEENKRLKDLFGAKTDFSITNFENNFNMMNPDEQTMFTGKAQGFFNRKGYTDKNGQRLKEDGVWGPKTQKTYERYREDEGYLSNEKDVKADIDPLTYESLSISHQIIPKNIKQSDYTNNMSQNKSISSSIKLASSDSSSSNAKAKKPSGEVNSVLSDPSQKLYNYLKSSSSSRSGEKNAEHINHTLETYMKESELRNDVTQYAIFKLLRSINNEKISPSKKNIEVVNMMVSILKTLANESTVHQEHLPTLNDAIQSTTKYNINASYSSVIKKWMKVYVALSDSCYPNNRSDKLKGTSINADIIDASINQMINNYNNGAIEAQIIFPARNDTTQVVYDTSNEDAEYRIIYSFDDSDAGKDSLLKEDDYSNFFDEKLKKWY